MNPFSSFSSVLTLQFLVLAEALQGGFTKVDLSGVMTSHVTPVFQVQTLGKGFVNLDIVFGCYNPTHNPSSVREMCLSTQFSGLTALQSLVTKEVLLAGRG